MALRLTILAVLVPVLGLTACAGTAPVPGGTETVNAAYYKSPDDFQSRVNRLQPGMPEALVFSIIGHNAGELTRLGRNDVLSALYGANSMQMMASAQERETTRAYVESLYGYRLVYKDVSKNHGFTSLIRIRTDENGFNYATNLIFQNGILLEKPIIEGGDVHDSESHTFFDYLNPGTLIGHAP